MKKKLYKRANMRKGGDQNGGKARGRRRNCPFCRLGTGGKKKLGRGRIEADLATLG